MSTTFYSCDVPEPARGLAASHRELRQAVAALRVAAGTINCPPEGHAFWSVLAVTTADLHHSLARHLRHEDRNDVHAPVRLPMADRELLEEQHTGLIMTAIGLGRLVETTRPGDERGWPALRACTQRMIEALEYHLELEARLLLSRSHRPLAANRTA